MKYSEKLRQYFYHRSHAGSLDLSMSSVHQVQVGQAANQEVLVLYIDYREHIVTAKFKAVGSVALIAGGEFICTWLENKSWQDLELLTTEFILKELGLDCLNIHTAQLILHAVRKLGYSHLCQTPI